MAMSVDRQEQLFRMRNRIPLELKEDFKYTCKRCGAKYKDMPGMLKHSKECKNAVIRNKNTN